MTTGERVAEERLHAACLFFPWFREVCATNEDRRSAKNSENELTEGEFHNYHGDNARCSDSVSADVSL